MLIDILENPSPYLRRLYIFTFLETIFLSLYCGLIICLNISDPTGILYLKSRSILNIIIGLCVSILIFYIQRFRFIAWPNSILPSKITLLFITIILSFSMAFFSSSTLFSIELERNFKIAKEKHIQTVLNAKDYLNKRESILQIFGKNHMINDSTIKNNKAIQRLDIEINTTINSESSIFEKSILNKIQNFVLTLKENKTFYFLFFFIVVLFILLFQFPLFTHSIAQENSNELVTERKKSTVNQIEIFSSIQHELGNKIPALKNDFIVLCDYIKNYQPELLNKRLREHIPGEELKDIDTIANIFERIENKLDYSIDVIKNAEGIIKSGPSNYHPEKTDLLEFVKNESKKVLHGQNNVETEFKGFSSFAVYIDKKQFSLVINNFIRNAIMHGETTNKIIFEVYDYGQTYIILNIRNNGKPLPPDFSLENFKRPFSYGGGTGNTGYGGFIIWNILQNHKAKLYYNNDLRQNDGCQVQFQITLPKYINAKSYSHFINR